MHFASNSLRQLREDVQHADESGLCVWQDLQDQLEDLTEQSNEIQEIMGRSYGMPEIDDDELDAELEALGDEIALDDDTSYLDEASKAPNAPTAIPGADSVTNKVIFFINFIVFMLICGIMGHEKCHFIVVFGRFL